MVRLTPLFLLAVCFQLQLSPGSGARAAGRQLPPGLDPLIRSNPPAVDRALKALKAGIEDYHKGQYAAALKDLPEDVDAASTLLGDYVLFYRAKSNLYLEQSNESLRLFRLLESRHPASPLIPEAVLGECRSLTKLHRPAETLSVLQSRKADESSESLSVRAEALELAGKKTEAQAIYLRIYTRYTASEAAATAEQRLKAVTPAFKLQVRNYLPMLERAENLLRTGRNRDARALLLTLAKVKPPGTAAGEKRRVLWAQVEFNLGRGMTLAPLLKKISPADPAIHAQSIYLLGLCYRRGKEDDLFLNTRDRALKLYPQSSFTEKLWFASAGHLELANRLEDARDAFALVAARFPKGEYAEASSWRTCMLLYFQGRYDEALQGFWRYRDAFSGFRSSIAALYWMGRCYEKLGDSERASYLYNRCSDLAGDHYYGQRARDGGQALRSSTPARGRSILTSDFAQVRKWADALHRDEAGIPQPSGPALAALERARQLVAADLPDAALTELRSALKLSPESRAIQYVMSRIYERKADYYGVIRTLRSAFPFYDTQPLSSLPQEIWDLLYPSPYRNVITAEAVKNQVDRSLVLAIIRQESAFSEDARSAANARGLMQVLPSTGRQLARAAGIRRYTAKELYRPEVNIALGIRFLADLLKEYGQATEIALAAYNAGTDRADRWKSDFGGGAGAEFVERIPFRETRDYIKQVLTNMAYYRMLAEPRGAGVR